MNCHRIEQRSARIEEAVDVVEAGGVEVVDGEGDVDLGLQGNLQDNLIAGPLATTVLIWWEMSVKQDKARWV